MVILHEDCCDHNIHSLTVSDLLVRPAIGCKDAAQALYALLALVTSVLWEAAVEILFNLIYCQGLSTTIFGKGIFVEIRVLQAQEDRSGGKLPHLATKSIG